MARSARLLKSACGTEARAVDDLESVIGADAGRPVGVGAKIVHAGGADVCLVTELAVAHITGHAHSVAPADGGEGGAGRAHAGVVLFGKGAGADADG